MPFGESEPAARVRQWMERVLPQRPVAPRAVPSVDAVVPAARALLLTDEAQINTKPQLEIFADDVKCTHGATVGPPPEEEIFYFRTRGMSEAMGRSLLTYGFADEVVSELEIAPIRERLDRHVFEKYRPE